MSSYLPDLHRAPRVLADSTAEDCGSINGGDIKDLPCGNHASLEEKAICQIDCGLD